MDIKDSEFLKRIQATFRIEAEEHLLAFSAGLEELGKSSAPQSLTSVIESLFREVHSLKGAARSVGQKEIESICQPLESIFSGLKKGEMVANPDLIELLYQSSDILMKIIKSPDMRVSFGDKEILRNLVQQIKSAVPGAKDTPSIPLVVQAPPDQKETNANSRNLLSEMVRIQVSKLDPLLLQAEEFLQTKISADQQTRELTSIHADVLEFRDESLKLKNRRQKATIEHFNEWVEASEIHLNNIENHLAMLMRSSERNQHSLDKLVDDHLDSMKELLLLPVSTLVESFPPMVREIARKQKKEVELIIHGSGLEVDKRLLEELKVPLIHLVRNSIDHGIGTPEERRMRNKPIRGTITIDFKAMGSGMIQIKVCDDGRGIQPGRVIEYAIKAGILTSEDSTKMNADEILSLIYHSGFSTSPIITDLSGRGLGLSIVREKVDNLNGRLLLETREHAGTTFSMILPMTLATFRGIVIGLGEFRFILPTMNVERVFRAKYEDIGTVENRETIRINDDILSLVSLAQILGIPEQHKTSTEYLRIMVLVSGSRRVAFKVDSVLDEHQVLVKGLGKLLKRVRNISGATILGSGQIVPVLHVPDLLKSALTGNGKQETEVPATKPVAHQGRILVAEDSITSRTLLKNILETAGYKVTTAVDGAAAYTRAKSDEFDLIVSDVDMPRMNGFELTTKIRGDKKLSEIPVVLVTSLESQDDRERGIDAGANAYIIKSSFDQGNLLEVIRKLI